MASWLIWRTDYGKLVHGETSYSHVQHIVELFNKKLAHDKNNPIFLSNVPINLTI